MECKALRESGEEIKKYNVAFFGASCDKESENKEFAKQLDLNFPLLSDTDKAVAKKYGILMRGIFSRRVTIYVDKEGKIAHIEKKVSVSEAGKQLIEQLGKLNFEKK